MKSIVRSRKLAAKMNRPGPKAKPGLTLLYSDPKYGFHLKLPRSWKCYTVVKRTGRTGDEEYGVHFYFKYKGKVYEPALSMLVFRMTLKKWRDDGYDESPFIRLAVRDGLIFAYIVPEELPSEFLNKSGDDYDYKKYGRPIRLLKHMVNDDVPRIVKTFKLK
ncbi:hypothetical protein [Paenibacillus sp. sgz500958]|uniref:hypothetical protein n=1 Tax=Paenibacillus sp. sgz500958 TaxID=3242475 RepID=UPI0036D40003